MNPRTSFLIKRLAALPFVIALFAAASGDGVSLGQATPITGEYVPGEVVVIERPDAGARSLTGAVAGAREVGRIPSLRLHRLKLPPDVTVEEALRRYAALPWVEATEPNYLLRAAVLPNDPLYASQSWYYSLLQAPAAWDIQTGNPSLLVAVVDSGVDLSHPDLDNNLWINPADPINGLDDDGNTIVDDSRGAAFISSPSPGCPDPQPANDPDDDLGHGTEVAGIIGAETNSVTPRGVAGTAWRAALMPLKVLDCAGVGNAFDTALAINYAASHGARIVNLSIVIPIARNGAGDCIEPLPPSTLGMAIQQAQATYGTAFVGAAGNEDCPYVAYPAAFLDVIAVGASAGSGSPGSRASFSNWGPPIDVAAPGQEVCSTAWSSALGASYTCDLAGTSFAAPIVSGLAALLLSRDPSLTPAQLRAAIEATAVNLPDGSAPNWDGTGRIDMRAALQWPSHRSFVPGVSRD